MLEQRQKIGDFLCSVGQSLQAWSHIWKSDTLQLIPKFPTQFTESDQTLIQPEIMNNLHMICMCILHITITT